MVEVLLSCLLSAAAGYATATLFAGKEAGQKGKMPSLKFTVNDYTVHVHHWLYASVVIAAFPAAMRVHLTVFFFFVGVIVHGLTYTDFYKIIYRQPANN